MSLNTLLDKAMSELNVYEFKLFFYVFGQTTGRGIKWSRISLTDMEGRTGISHPTVLKYMGRLKGESNDQEDEAQREKWVKMKKVKYRYPYGHLYAVGDNIRKEYES